MDGGGGGGRGPTASTAGRCLGLCCDGRVQLARFKPIVVFDGLAGNGQVAGVELSRTRTNALSAGDCGRERHDADLKALLPVILPDKSILGAEAAAAIGLQPKVVVPLGVGSCMVGRGVLAIGTQAAFCVSLS